MPRFGATWERPIAQGVGVADVLDAIGVGHYPGTAMPGQVGNFAIAAHRHAYGGGFENLHLLHVGDHVYIGTKDGWYEYTFRDIEYVKPTQVNVLQPVPMEPGVAPVDRLITMTTCNPFFSTAERMIAYGVFDRWYPYAEGPPSRDRRDRCAGGIADVRSTVAGTARTLVGARAHHPACAGRRDSRGVRVLDLPVDPAVRVAAAAGYGQQLAASSCRHWRLAASRCRP